jgi:hypothetical protein
MLGNSDLQDMLEQPYISGDIFDEPHTDINPGGGRVLEFFKSMYGESRIEVGANLIKVEFCGRRLLFNQNNDASKSFERVGKEIEHLLKKNPGLKKYIIPTGGTFVWRVIEGTDRLSPHSFGIAMDLNAKYCAYWLWPNQGDISKLRKKYPCDIVRIFEQENFIWGGKWFLYDLMHFEYRPELFIKAKIIRLIQTIPSIIFLNIVILGSN